MTNQNEKKTTLSLELLFDFNPLYLHLSYLESQNNMQKNTKILFLFFRSSIPLSLFETHHLSVSVDT